MKRSLIHATHFVWVPSSSSFYPNHLSYTVCFLLAARFLFNLNVRYRFSIIIRRKSGGCGATVKHTHTRQILIAFNIGKSLFVSGIKIIIIVHYYIECFTANYIFENCAFDWELFLFFDEFFIFVFPIKHLNKWCLLSMFVVVIDM